MKRCPECRRDYCDDTLLYCLDDGNALLEGPASKEPKTAILPPGELQSEARTKDYDSRENRNPGAAKTASAQRRSRAQAKILLPALVLLVVIAGGFLAYRYLIQPDGKQIESIAVIPFVNESGSSDVECLSDGMTETLINSLSQLDNLKVKARSSAFRYRGKEADAGNIGNEPSVQAILNRRVVQRGDELTLFLSLVDTKTENQIWGNEYNRKMTNLVLLQAEIAREVSANLKTKLSGTEEQKWVKTYTQNTDAYKLYFKGRYSLNKRTSDGLIKAVDFFQQAIQMDGNYALATIL